MLAHRVMMAKSSGFPLFAVNPWHVLKMGGGREIPQHAGNGDNATGTLELVVVPDSASGQRYAYEEGGSGKGISAYLDGTTLHLGIWTGFGGDVNTRGSASVTAGRAHHGLLRHRNTDGTRILIDGQTIADNTGPTNLGAHSGTNGFGRVEQDTRDHVETTSGPYPYYGHVRWLRRWTSSRSASGDALSGPLVGTESNLALEYHADNFNEGSGTLVDSTGSHNVTASPITRETAGLVLAQPLGAGLVPVAVHVDEQSYPVAAIDASRRLLYLTTPVASSTFSDGQIVGLEFAA